MGEGGRGVPSLWVKYRVAAMAQQPPMGEGESSLSVNPFHTAVTDCGDQNCAD